MLIESQKGYRPLLVEGNSIYAWKNGRLWISTDGADSFQSSISFSAGLLEALGGRLPLASRVLRGGLHDLVRMNSGVLVGVARGAIVYSDGNDFNVTHKILRGSRPLGLCHANNCLYFGEYFGNEKRDGVDIYKSENGLDWEVIHRFPPGSIRHVHGIVEDTFRQGLWVMTGDSDSESALWFTDDDFSTLRPVVSGSQQARAVSIIPTQAGLIVPMDSPLEKNYINFYNLQSESMEKGPAVESSVFFSAQLDGLYFVSTAAEPSAVNNISDSILYASENGLEWVEIFRAAADGYSKLSSKIFQYPTLAMPRNIEGDSLYCYGRSLKGLDDALIKISAESARAVIQKIS